VTLFQVQVQRLLPKNPNGERSFAPPHTQPGPIRDENE
jgi:hypothetical protein